MRLQPKLSFNAHLVRWGNTLRQQEAPLSMIAPDAPQVPFIRNLIGFVLDASMQERGDRRLR